MSEGFPTESQAFTPPPEKKSGGGKTVLIVLGVLGLLSCCCCFGCGGFIWFGLSQGASQVKAKYADDPVVLEMLGGIDSCEMNFGDMMTEAQTRENTFVFDVEGPKGSGQLILWAPDQDLNNPQEATLRVGAGEYPIGDSGVFLE